MVAPYPGLRRRRGQPPVVRPLENDDNADNNVEEQRVIGRAGATTRRQRRTRRQQQQQQYQPKLSSLYFLVSLCLALMAIIITSSSSHSPSTTTATTTSILESKNTVEQGSTTTTTEKLMGAPSFPFDTPPSDYVFKSLRYLFSSSSSEEKNKQEQQQQQQQRSVPPLFRWMLPPVNKEQADKSALDTTTTSKNPLLSFFYNIVDPSLLQFQSSTPTDIIDKILTSTPRILAIANLLLAFTWLLHSFVANLFLGPNAVAILQQESNRTLSSWAGRERLGGFLVFKLLLISAVVAPDTLDLLILLSWYTLLSFFKSLAHLCAATIAHSSSSGLPPQRGVLRLLVVVLLSDILAASVCVALFHGAGWGMVLLLTCDCALLMVDVLSHALQHVSQVLEDSHSAVIRELEERQVDVHTILNQTRNDEDDDDEDDDVASNVDRTEELREESRMLDRRMEFLETSHARRVRILDTLVFGLQLLAHALTVAHFCHIWSLHGLQFTLVDGVLALHLHSALSAAGKKIAERRNLNRIARDLDSLFEDATEMDMRKAGDVCCICLVTMTTGNVKRVGCGHLYHTTCLREVVERARSIEAAKCPLCRASVLDGRHSDSGGGNNGGGADTGGGDNAGNVGQQQPRGGPGENGGVAVVPPQPQQGAAAANVPPLGEHALFRFSTENILPAWLPLPAFSFEVVRRPPVAFEATANEAAQQQQGNANRNNNNDAPRPSFFRRLLIMTGAIPMSPEETAMYLDQLVDMFPQYDRADLLRELRMRGSSEAVVEAVLMGVFSGVPRGELAAVQGPRGQAVPMAQRRQVANVIDDGDDSEDDDDDDRQ